MREYRLVFGTSESCDVFLRKSDDEEDLLRSMHELALLGGEVGRVSEECPAMAPTGALHRFGYNPLLGTYFCQDCGQCACPEHQPSRPMHVFDTGPDLGRGEDTTTRGDFLRRFFTLS